MTLLFKKMIAYFVLAQKRELTEREHEILGVLRPFIENIDFYQKANNPFDEDSGITAKEFMQYCLKYQNRLQANAILAQNTLQAPVTLPQSFAQLRQLAQRNCAQAHSQIQPTVIAPSHVLRNLTNDLETSLEPQALKGVGSAFLDFSHSGLTYLDLLEFIGALSAVCQAYNRTERTAKKPN